MENSMNSFVGAFLPLIVLFAIFYFVLIRPQLKQQKAHKEMLANLKKGDKVITNGGLICEIVKVEDKFFSVKLNDDTQVRLSKDFIFNKYEEENK
ncbi:preprotein translocase subunit YajC [Helicobacter sp. MIT 99-5507]|uniref:preprotein translocase subunit YajC n=1 Tax=Helicobacter sp. MIT 99-5507 TaxID=152489 RepID=UPI000E1F3F9A|nr:preprotein translocase subunit YajC [Helicobacter sp. MIT 99-5507]RDU58546.1 preprotein translocase subunit YajC [Helicobacter sp. MIT 99-5507]